MRSTAHVNKIVNALNKFILYDHHIFEAKKTKNFGSWTINVYEIDDKKERKPVLSRIQLIHSFSEILFFSFLISVDIDTNTPHYYIY